MLAVNSIYLECGLNLLIAREGVPEDLHTAALFRLHGADLVQAHQPTRRVVQLVKINLEGSECGVERKFDLGAKGRELEGHVGGRRGWCARASEIVVGSCGARKHYNCFPFPFGS